MTRTYIKEAMDAITTAYKNNKHIRYFGVRGDDTGITVGQELDPSYDWDYENDRQSDRKLSGTCAVKIGYLWYDGEEEDLEEIEKAIAYYVKNYQYKNISVIGGSDQEYGADENETIITNAEVIYIFPVKAKL
jgi:hypothetical protein